MNEEEAEREVETDERNIGNLTTDDHLVNSQSHLFIHRHES